MGNFSFHFILSHNPFYVLPSEKLIDNERIIPTAVDLVFPCLTSSVDITLVCDS